ncbi:glucosylglycerol-phosphate synthase [Chitinophaga sp. ARDCPP14]|uniref:glucosylglycerol-phosphate synthase n=1 Tax=Chitinophaga sp. ARDCPP14 TaxID=3391139 RepID=UPI003F526F0A
MKRKIIVLYHRQPYEEVMVNGSTIYRRDAGKPNGIIPLLKGFFSVVPDGMWIAGSEFVDSPSVPVYERIDMPEAAAACTLKRVLITKEELNCFYHKTSKEGFWPILHSFHENFDCQKINWENFVMINKRFAEAALEEADSNTTVWIHDYNLWLAPYFIRKKAPDVKIAFFLHTPFPGPDIFNVISWREKIIESLLCCNHIVFSIPRYIENFIAVAKSVTNISIKQRKKVTPYFSQSGNALSEPVVTSKVLFDNRTVQLDAIPVGTSCARIDQLLKNRRIKSSVSAIRSQFKDRILIFAASRMDYVKGMDKLLECYSRLLDRRPELKGKVVLSLVAVQPAAGITAYDQFQIKIRQQVARIISAHGAADWTPVIYSEAALSFEEMVSWFSATDIMWVPSLRDGTNLVCKEFLAVKKGGKGVLVLSEFVGAAVELHEAVLTNPYSYNSMDNAIDQALEMSVQDQEARNRKLYLKVRHSDVQRWSKRLTDLGGKKLNNHPSFALKTS